MPGWQTVAIRSNRHTPGDPAQTAADPVQPLDQVRLIHRRRQRSRATRRNGPASRPAGAPSTPTPTTSGGSGRSSQSHWVSSPAGCAMTAFARSVARPAGRRTTGRSCRARIWRVRRLIRQRRTREASSSSNRVPRPQMRILDQPRGHVVDERRERVRCGAFAHPGFARRRSGSSGPSCGPGRHGGRSR